MRAVVVDPSNRLGFDFAEVDEPELAHDQALVSVDHIALNRGDLNDARSGRVSEGAILGSDLAGTVLQGARDGTGPPVGHRVVALTGGAFAERVAVNVQALALVPATVELAEAAALPVAGLAALQALRVAGMRRGKRVLVTGASGGVGGFAVQLAVDAGAHVVAAVGSASKMEALRELGADEVVVSLEAVAEPVDIVLDNVGGPTLVAAWDLLAQGGSLQSIGWASGEPAAFRPYATIGPPKSLTSFLISGDIGADLSTLLTMVQAHRLTVDIGWRGSWTDIHGAADAMRQRSLRSKAILDVDVRDR